MKCWKINLQTAATQQADKKEPVIGKERKKLYAD
jgi:hypothetical protein